MNEDKLKEYVTSKCYDVNNLLCHMLGGEYLRVFKSILGEVE